MNRLDRKLRDQRDGLLRAPELSDDDRTERSATSLLQITALAAEAIRLQQGFSAFAVSIGR